IPPSVSPIPLAKVAVTLLVFRSTRATVWSPQFGTHKLPNPIARPEHGLLPTSIVADTLLVLGSSRATLFFGLFEIHTSWPTAIQSGDPGTSKTASGLSKVIGNFTPGVFTPGFGCRGGRVPFGACSSSIDRLGNDRPSSESKMHRVINQDLILWADGQA